jgi:hypothetical protein
MPRDSNPFPLLFQSGPQEATDYYNHFLGTRSFQTDPEKQKRFFVDETTPDWYRPTGERYVLASGEIVHNEQGQVYITFFPVVEAVDRNLSRLW